jgi:hypothetical protein
MHVIDFSYSEYRPSGAFRIDTRDGNQGPWLCNYYHNISARIAIKYLCMSWYSNTLRNEFINLIKHSDIYQDIELIIKTQ